jgi:hypothetical protein
MNHVFKITEGFLVPDGTTVYPFLNSKDVMSSLAWDLVDNVSVAVGDIGPSSHSAIHIHPIVTLITWVVSGKLTIKMRDPQSAMPYAVPLEQEQAALICPGTFLQHVNTSPTRCRVLYIVSPAYLFIPETEGSEAYDDAIVVGDDWEVLAQQQWSVPQIQDMREVHVRRQRAFRYLAQNKAGTASLTPE